MSLSYVFTFLGWFDELPDNVQDWFLRSSLVDKMRFLYVLLRARPEEWE